MQQKARRLIALLAALALLAACIPARGVDVPGPIPPGPALPPYDPSATPGPFAPGDSPAPPVVATASATATPPPEVGPQTGRLNLLLLGVDERETWTEGPPRTDSMMLVSLDASAGTAVVISIPRDLWVNIPGFGQERVNIAYRVAELAEPGTGVDEARATVSELLGVPVHRYAVVNFRAVRQIIDSLGGLDIDVPREIWDYQYPTEDNQYMTVHFEAGRQVLNGEQVLQYVRTRHDSSDFERMRRQQQVLQAIKVRITEPAFVTGLPGLLLLAKDSVRTDLSVSEMVSLWRAFRDSPADAIQFRAIDESLSYPWITMAGAAVLLPDGPGIAALVGSLGLGDGVSEPKLARGLQVRLYASSTDDPGFAAAAEVLARAGFSVWQGGVAVNDASHTLVLDYTNGESGPEIARALGLDTIQVLNLPKPPNMPEDLAADILLWSTQVVAG